MIELRDITRENWQRCAGLHLPEHQRRFVPPNVYSIAAWKFYPGNRLLAVYNGDGVMVGFVMYGREEPSGRWKIFRVMVDSRFQRRGYGRAAAIEILRKLRTEDEAAEVYISYHPDNDPAMNLYRSLGFVEVEATDQKVTARLRFEG